MGRVLTAGKRKTINFKGWESENCAVKV